MAVTENIIEGSFVSYILSVFIGIIVVILGYVIWPFVNNKLRHVPGPTPLPLFGNWPEGIKMEFGKYDAANLKKYGKYFRSFEGRDPSIVIGDQEILKQIMVKEFDNFADRGKMILRGVLQEGLVEVRGAKWRRLRHLMAPGFTSARLKKMIPSIVRCIDRIEKNIEVQGNGAFDAKVITASYTMDAIAITGFGIDIDSKSDQDNPFLRHCLAISKFQLGLGFLCAFFIPFTTGLFERLGVCMFPSDSMEFLERLIQKILDERKKDKKPRQDLLQLMVDAHNEELCQEGLRDLKGVNICDKEKGMSDSEVIALSLTFFLGAFDTTSTSLAFLMYELSENPDVQEKLHEEVSEVMTHHMEMNLDAISEMPYLDQCIQEITRKYPVLSRVDREAKAGITINGLYIPRDTRVVIPIYALHHDPDVWPDPDKFDPDRFTSEAKKDRPALSHLPFGIGPRRCIGMRLGLIKLKMACVKMVQKFKFLPAGVKPDLEINLFIRSRNGIMVKAEKR